MAVIERIVRKRLNDQTGHFEYLIQFQNTDLDEENGWYLIEEIPHQANLEELFAQFNLNMNAQDLQNNTEDRDRLVQEVLELEDEVNVRNNQHETWNESLEEIVMDELIVFDGSYEYQILENTT